MHSGEAAETDEARRLAEQAELEREEQARLAVAEERARIARELHDVVGHSVSVMTVQASAVRRLLEADQEKEREALLVVEQTGREALAEMRRMVGVLRRPDEAPALAPQPSLEHIERLVAHTRETGLPVELRIEGTPVPLPAGIDTTAYRIVQEGADECGQARPRCEGRGRRAVRKRHGRANGERRRPGRRRRRGADTGLSGCASECPCTEASWRPARRRAAASVSVPHSPPREPGRERHHHTHLPVQRRRGIDGPPAPAPGRVRRRDRRSRAAAAGAWADAGGRELDAEETVLRRVPPAGDAVEAAVAAQRALATHDMAGGVDLRVRIGVHTGEATPPGDQYVGLAVHRAARICGRAGGQILRLRDNALAARRRGGRARRHRVDLGEHLLKDFDRPVRIYQLSRRPKLATGARTASASGC